MKPLVCCFPCLGQPLVCGHFALRDADYTVIWEALNVERFFQLRPLAFQAFSEHEQLKFGVVVGARFGGLYGLVRLPLVAAVVIVVGVFAAGLAVALGDLVADACYSRRASWIEESQMSLRGWLASTWAAVIVRRDTPAEHGGLTERVAGTRDG